MQDPLVGRVLEQRYRVLSALGRGGYGAVYLGLQLALEREVAIKVLHRLEEEPRARFEREARALSELDHPSIVRVIDYGFDEGTPFLVLERMKGESVRERLRRTGRLPVAEALAVALDVARGLRATHELGIVHRDLKPENVMLVAGEERERAVLLDFGVATRRLTEHEPTLTDQGMIVGTPGYIAPEAALAGEVSPAGDVYALGVLLFECLVGRHPFTAPTPAALLLAHVQEPVPRVLERASFDEGVAPAVQTHIDPLVRRLLAKDPADRPAAGAAVELLQASLVAVGASVEVSSPGAPQPPAGAGYALHPETPTESLGASRSRAPAGVASADAAVADAASANAAPANAASANAASADAAVADAASVDAASGDVPSPDAPSPGAPSAGAPSAGVPSMSRLVWPFAVGGLAAVALGLFGWWAPTSGTASAPPGAGPGAPDGRELVIGLPSPRGPLSPLITGRSDARDLLSTFVIQPFLAIDPVGQLTPVTTTATVDLERQEVRLRLLGGVRFHAHPTCLEARPATPDDVLASIHLAREMATANFENVQPDQARVEGEEVVVPFSSNRGDEVYELDWVRLLPLEIARDRCDDPFDLAFPVGTGTHRLAAPPAGEALTLVRVDGADSPFARIRTVPVRDLKEALKLIDKGELDLYRDWVPASLSELIEQREGRLALREGALPPLQRPVQMLPWGLRNHFGVVGIIPRRDRAGPLAERRVRQAVALAIDPAPLKTGLAYMERPEKRFLQPWMLGYDPELEPLPVDRARARALLAGRESPIQIVLEVGASGKGAAPVLIEQLAEVGIEVTLVEGDAPGNAVLATSAAPMQGVDPTRALFSFVVAIGQATPPGERVRPALDAAGQARRQEDKRRALRDLEAALLEELPMMPIGLARRDPLFGTMVASERLAPLTEGGEDFVGLVIREYAPRTLRWADAP